MFESRGFGADASPIDLRDFKHKVDKVSVPSQKGGERYKPEDIEDQHRVGICTAISLTQNAAKATGLKYSADFQYLLQKKFYDGNWNEGSSARSALHIAYTYGLLPDSEWKHTKISDRKLQYSKYIKKLQSVSDEEISRLLVIAGQHKLAGYARVPVNRDALASAIDESKAGIIVRFVVGNEWYRSPIEPLRRSSNPISGHLITESNYDGMSGRVANTWGSDWADKGTAYFDLRTYQPTEAWIPYYKELPPSIEEQKQKIATLQGKIISLLQILISRLQT